MASKPTGVPTIGAGVQVETRSKNPRLHGTVIRASGRKKWEVEVTVNGEKETREFTSNQLQVYKEYYNQSIRSPLKSAIKTIEKIVDRTVGRRGRTRARRSRQNNGNSCSSSNSFSSSPSRSEQEDEDFQEPSPDVSISSSVLGTPTLLFRESPDTSNSVSNESEGDASFNDGREVDEDDAALREAMPVYDNNEDGGGRPDFIDRPQSKIAYEKAFKAMTEEKQRLIAKKHQVSKTVKTKNKYAVGGRVEGGPKSIHKGRKGTIADVFGGDVYLVEWDDSHSVSCRMEKKNLRLQQGLSTTYKWTTVKDHIAPNPPTPYKDIGLVDFKFKDFNPRKPTSFPVEVDDEEDHPFARLIEKLWPGDWREQLDKMNEAVRQAKIREVEEDEWWTYWGIMIFSAYVGEGRPDKLWDKGKNNLLPEIPTIDMTNRMKRYRFDQIKALIPKAFEGDNPQDPWNPVLALIIGFNNKRAQDIAASHCKVHDESMSSFRPRTTKTGGLPFLSFILRKPKPLGTEFKVTACTVTGKF